jgi:hypothetical protein
MAPSLPIAERLTARAAVALPRPVQRLVFGAPVRRDGLELAPEVQTLAKLDRWVGPGTVDQVPVAGARRRLRHDALVGGYFDYGSTQAEIASHLGCHYSTVCRWLRRAEIRSGMWLRKT